MAIADTPPMKPKAPPVVVGLRQLVALALVALAAAVAARYSNDAVPVIAAAVVAAMIPRQRGWNVRAPLALAAALLALFVVRLWPTASEAAAAVATPAETPHLLSWIIWLPIAGAIGILFVPREAQGALRASTLAIKSPGRATGAASKATANPGLMPSLSTTSRWL